MITIFGFRISERQFLLLYLLTAILLLTGLAGWVLYRTYDFPSVNVLYLSDKIKREQRLFDQQTRYLPMLDSAHRTIAAYRPEITAVFMEADIENQISDIRRVYTTNDTLLFFRAFDQAANFYQMMYNDKKILSSKQFNANLFSKQLEDCALGFQPVPPAGSSIQPIQPALPTQR